MTTSNCWNIASQYLPAEKLPVFVEECQMNALIGRCGRVYNGKDFVIDACVFATDEPAQIDAVNRKLVSLAGHREKCCFKHIRHLQITHFFSKNSRHANRISMSQTSHILHMCGSSLRCDIMCVFWSAAHITHIRQDQSIILTLNNSSAIKHIAACCLIKLAASWHIILFHSLP